MHDFSGMETRGFITQKKSKKNSLSDYNFYLAEASSSDSVDTEYSVSGVEDGRTGDETFLNESSSEEEGTGKKEKETDYFLPAIKRKSHNNIEENSSLSSTLLMSENLFENSSEEKIKKHGNDTIEVDDSLKQSIHNKNSSNTNDFYVMTHGTMDRPVQEKQSSSLEFSHCLKPPHNDFKQNDANGLYDDEQEEEGVKNEEFDDDIIKEVKTNNNKQLVQQKKKKNMNEVNSVIMKEHNTTSFHEQVLSINDNQDSTNTVVLLKKENSKEANSKINFTPTTMLQQEQQQQQPRQTHQTSNINNELTETPTAVLAGVGMGENVQKTIDEGDDGCNIIPHVENPAMQSINNTQTIYQMNKPQQDVYSTERFTDHKDNINVYKQTNSKQNIEQRVDDIVSHNVILKNNPDTTFSPIRADQFNKICPSPFDGVPGFRRSCSTSTSYRRQSKREKEILVSPKLSKSSSLDTAAANLLLSPVVVGRDKWIRFEEQERLQDVRIASIKQNHHRPSEKITKSNTLDSSLCQTHEWISFDTNPKSSKPVQTELIENDISDPADGCHSDDADDQDLISKSTEGTEERRKLRKDKLTRSTENVLNAVNKTMSHFKTPAVDLPADQEELIGKCDKDPERTSSELSDEVISLDFDTDEEKLRDTPVKQFPDVSLFQAKNATRDSERKERLDSSSICDTKVIANKDATTETFAETLHQYPPPISPTSWKFWYRYPDRKKRLRSRKWLPVNIEVEGDFLRINGSSSTEMSKEIPLHPFYVFTVPVLHKGNKDGNVHSVKLQYVKYKEKRGIRARFGIEHVPIYTPVVKLSSRDVITLREFISHVESLIRHIPTHRDKGVTYSHEEIFIDSEDQCQYLIAGDGRILKYNVTVQLRLRVFVTGNPELKLFLNDLNNKEILSKTKEALLHDEVRKPTSNWISPELYEYHPCVDPNKSVKEGGVVFIPPDGCSFELLRFRVRKCNPLPLIGTSSIEVLATNTVHLKADIRVNGDAKSIRHKRTGVVLYIPVPPSWSKLFLKPTSFGRKSKTYISVKNNDKFLHPTKVSNSRVTLTVSIGTATYEPAYGSIVWKIGMLPAIRDGIPVDVLHSFQCLLELPFPLQIREEFQPYSYLEYNVAHQIGSDVSVEEILVSDGRVPEKWVCYRSSYMHKMEMKIWEDGKLRKCS